MSKPTFGWLNTYVKTYILADSFYSSIVAPEHEYPVRDFSKGGGEITIDINTDKTFPRINMKGLKTMRVAL